MSFGELEISAASMSGLKQAYPPFPIQFLKGKPVFWDDFESGPAGFIMPERALAYQTLNTGPSTFTSGRWNVRDGNEYGAYITANASSSGKRSLFTGGDPTTRTYGDVGNQDVSCDVLVPSGVIGVEFDVLFATGTGAGAHLLSIEDKDPATATRFRELQLQIAPFSLAGAIYLMPGTITILSTAVADSNGIFLSGMTGPVKGAATSFSRGITGAWHRVGFIVDMNIGQWSAAFFDKHFINCVPQGTSKWNIVNPDSTVRSLQEGLRRIEFHSLTAGSSFAPGIFHDNVVVTDEVGQTYP